MAYPKTRRSLDGDTVLIRWLDPDTVDATLWPALERLLDSRERNRAARFHVEADRRSYVAGHALMRAMLSSRVPVSPADWRFAEGAHGKPEAVMPPGAPPLRVNLSHARGMAAVALAVGHEVGVDVERRERGDLTLELAERFFAPSEVVALRALPDDRRTDGLFAVWTLKEAVIKALGRGLAMPLDSFAVDWEPPGVTFAPGASAATDWLLRRFRPGPAHVLALALRHPEPGRVAVRARAAGVDDLLAAAG